MINGKHYDWEEMIINLPSGVAFTITDISYKDSREVEEVYGKGSNPTGYGSGNYQCDGSFTIKRDEQTLFETAINLLGKGNGFYRHPPFPITVSYGDGVNPLETDVLPACLLTGRDLNPKQGDKSIEVKYDFKCIEPLIANGVAAN